jgi:cytochrome c biogenesis factor
MDWYEAQLALIETRMVTMAQVFLPYAVTATSESMYEYVAQHSNLLLGDGQ